MRILLCDRLTGMFFQSDAKWTSDPSQAKNFQTSPRAILFADENGIRGAEVYWDFDDSEYNVRLPICPDANQMAA